MKRKPSKLFKGAPATLDEASLARSLRHLSQRDRDLAWILHEHGRPQMWAREPGFATLIYIILEQQVSLASAKAVFDRLTSAVAGPLTAARFLALNDSTLKSAGFSRQKIAYGKNIAALIEEGRLDLGALGAADDEVVRSTLLRIKGVGPWTTEIYLLRALNRPDAWPGGDLALAVAVQEIRRLPERPTPLELETIAEPWRPWRAVAARLLWQYYLNRPARPVGDRIARKT
ncbi:MAG: DNA-3-methyladenine glycosylase 2 family protein [Acidobacteria bacterium]|nr:DNA-3-methyladenine glycosylase 2 family protein [Acidobacteriota bacterium]